MSKGVFHALHYNMVAKRIRKRFPMETGADRERTIISLLACDFALKFAADNVAFDPLKFLDACSPDDTIYPLSELWEDFLLT